MSLDSLDSTSKNIWEMTWNIISTYYFWIMTIVNWFILIYFFEKSLRFKNIYDGHLSYQVYKTNWINA